MATGFGLAGSEAESGTAMIAMDGTGTALKKAMGDVTETTSIFYTDYGLHRQMGRHQSDNFLKTQ